MFASCIRTALFASDLSMHQNSIVCISSVCIFMHQLCIIASALLCFIFCGVVEGSGHLVRGRGVS
jgi:hypothetical protein